jgi:hypothetical protein
MVTMMDYDEHGDIGEVFMAALIVAGLALVISAATGGN